VTRSEWSGMMADTMAKARQDVAAAKAMQLERDLDDERRQKAAGGNRL
jgi:hypothetical protein